MMKGRRSGKASLWASCRLLFFAAVLSAALVLAFSLSAQHSGFFNSLAGLSSKPAMRGAGSLRRTGGGEAQQQQQRSQRIGLEVEAAQEQRGGALRLDGAVDEADEEERTAAAEGLEERLGAGGEGGDVPREQEKEEEEVQPQQDKDALEERQEKEAEADETASEEQQQQGQAGQPEQPQQEQQDGGELVLGEEEDSELVLGEGETTKAQEESKAQQEEDSEEQEEEESSKGQQVEEQEVEAGEALLEDEESDEGREAGQQAGECQGPSPYQRALSTCRDLACVTEAAREERSPGQLRFPHFFVVGWQKCATTSLFWHLKKHPKMMVANVKEPEFFSDDCGFRPASCPPAAQEQYLLNTLRLGEVLAANLTVAAAEASTHYGRNGALLAEGVYEHFPWLKVVASMREPISRMISMLAHNLDKSDKGCLAKREAYPCLLRELTVKKTNYSEPFQAWLDVFPREQVFLIQYEQLVSQERGRQVLRQIKTFLEVDPALPLEEDFIGHNNSRAQHMMKKGELAPGEQPEGWPMTRAQYEELVELVRPDAERMANIVDKYGFGDGVEWMAAWEAEWLATLDACTPEGDCEVFPN